MPRNRTSRRKLPASLEIAAGRAHPRRVFAGRWDGQTDRYQPGALFYALFCVLHYLTQKRQKQNPYTREYLPYFPRGKVLKIRFLCNVV